LSRTAYQALKIVNDGVKSPARVFGRYQETEERRFMGDLSFWKIIQELLESSHALLKLSAGRVLTLPVSPKQELTITSAGEEVLAGKRSWLDYEKIDRWIGGVHLTSTHIWCWDSVTRSIEKRV
jgi:hypothetical protein